MKSKLILKGDLFRFNTLDLHKTLLRKALYHLPDFLSGPCTSISTRSSQRFRTQPVSPMDCAKYNRSGNEAYSLYSS